MHPIRQRRAHFGGRAIIPDVLTDVLGTDIPTPSLSLPVGEITSLIPLPTLLSPASGSLSDSFSSSSSPSSASSTSTSSLSSLTQSNSSTLSSTPTSSPTPAPSVYETTSGGKVHTITTFLDAAPSASSSVVPPPPKSFLQNKVLSGVVFALIGLVGLIVILALATFALRRKRNNKLMREAISFDPSLTFDSTHHYGTEKGRLSAGFGSPRSSDDHNGLGATGYAFGAQGRAEKDSNSFPQPPPRALSPQGYMRGPGEMLPAPGQPDGINWGPSLTPFTAPLPTFGASNETEGTVDERAISQNRILKVANN